MTRSNHGPLTRDASALIVEIERDGVAPSVIADRYAVPRDSVYYMLASHAQRYQQQHPDLLARLQTHSTHDPDSGCWQWIGGTSAGYPSLRYQGRGESARRLAWQWAHGALPPRIRVHATWLARLKVPPSTISARLGHASVAYTLDVYVWPATAEQRAASDQLDAASGRRVPSTVPSGHNIGLLSPSDREIE